MRAPALVIFDCDGVLVNSEHISHSILHALLIEHGAMISYEETVERFLGTSTAGFLEKVGAIVGGRCTSGFLDRFRNECLAAFLERLTAVPGVEDVLRSLSVPFCVASNGRHLKMKATLGMAGLLKYFDGRIFSVEDVSQPKPAPDLFLHAAQTFGAAPRECVVVEDSPTGIQAARAAGMRTLGFAAITSAHRLLSAGAHSVFDSMNELPSLLWVHSRASVEGTFRYW
jgi:HAD superfamily hydrolase (TIGR01509 family)